MRSRSSMPLHLQPDPPLTRPCYLLLPDEVQLTYAQTMFVFIFEMPTALRIQGQVGSATVMLPRFYLVHVGSKS